MPVGTVSSPLFRRDFQALARTRIAEAQTLLKAGHCDGAYYLAGLAIECALKACIAKSTRRYQFPPERKTIEAVYQHKLERLVEVAGLREALAEALNVDQELRRHWRIVRDWKVETRYRNVDPKLARDMLNTITHTKSGVLKWLRKYW